MTAWIITRRHTAPYKYPATAAGYLTAGDNWREFRIDELLTFDILPHIFTNYEQAFFWIMRNGIRTYDYKVTEINLLLEVKSNA